MRMHKRESIIIKTFRLTSITKVIKTTLPFLGIILALDILCSASLMDAIEGAAKRAGENEKVFSAALNLEISSYTSNNLTEGLLSLVFPGFSPSKGKTEALSSKPIENSLATPTPTPLSTPLITPVPTKLPKPTDQTQTTKPAAELTSEGILLKGDTEGIDIQKLFGEKLNLSFKGAPQILIIHTHGTESYLCDGSYKESGSSHTLDARYSVIRVGDELVSKLGEKGYTALHDKGIYDFPSYTGSYERSMKAIQTYLNKYPSIKIVLDIHRDAALDAAGNAVKASAIINGSSTAQIMLVVGKGSTEQPNPNWEENMKLALRIQAAMISRYPGLSRPISVSSNRYNEHLSHGSVLAEIGCNGDSLEEALASARLFADALALAFSGY